MEKPKIVYCTTRVNKIWSLSHEDENLDEGNTDNSPELYRLFFLRLIGITYQMSLCQQSVRMTIRRIILFTFKISCNWSISYRTLKIVCD